SPEDVPGTVDEISFVTHENSCRSRCLHIIAIPAAESQNAEKLYESLPIRTSRMIVSHYSVSTEAYAAIGGGCSRIVRSVFHFCGRAGRSAYRRDSSTDRKHRTVRDRAAPSRRAARTRPHRAIEKVPLSLHSRR